MPGAGGGGHDVERVGAGGDGRVAENERALGQEERGFVGAEAVGFVPFHEAAPDHAFLAGLRIFGERTTVGDGNQGDVGALADPGEDGFVGTDAFLLGDERKRSDRQSGEREEKRGELFHGMDFFFGYSGGRTANPEGDGKRPGLVNWREPGAGP